MTEPTVKTYAISIIDFEGDLVSTEMFTGTRKELLVREMEVYAEYYGFDEDASFDNTHFLHGLSEPSDERTQAILKYYDDIHAEDNASTSVDSIEIKEQTPKEQWAIVSFSDQEVSQVVLFKGTEQEANAKRVEMIFEGYELGENEDLAKLENPSPERTAKILNLYNDEVSWSVHSTKIQVQKIES